MNLEELRASLESDASKRADVQKQMINELQRELDESREHIEYLEEKTKHLEKRCFVHSDRFICAFCRYRGDCSATKGYFET